MSEVAPMRGRRVKKARCRVQGHPCCELVQSAKPYTRTQEARLLARDDEPEGDEDDQ